jgi:ADP-dependent NAD(P)H-hydrate dehydratase / NAD(P)H-hydrate epimerase
MLLIDPKKLKEYEVKANELGFTFDEMMRVAGRGLAEEVNKRFCSQGSKKVIGLIGGGKNGTDTLIALTVLHSLGLQTGAIRVTSSELPVWAVNEYKNTGNAILDVQEKDKVSRAIKDSDIILDGIIGTGFEPPMRSELSEKMKNLKKLCEGKQVVAVDCPSGVDCSTGSVDRNTISAAVTVCMEAVKPGLLKFPAFNYAGEIYQVDIGIVKKIHQDMREVDLVLDNDLIAQILPLRKKDSHKGSFGSVLVCGGSVNYPGAPVFTAKAAYRTGTGLVKTAVPERIYEICAGQCLESTWLVLDDENGVISESANKLMHKEMQKANCLAIGPGLGIEETTFRFFKDIILPGNGKERKAGIGFLPNDAFESTKIDYSPSFVIDADGLRLLARIEHWENMTNQKMVLTPHPGEMSALTGLSVDEIQANRMEICRQFSKQWNQVIVLKGALTVIANTEGKIAVCPVASSTLAKAGSGDLLTGLIAGFVAQGVERFEASLAGVWVHANAGLLATEAIKSERSAGIYDILSQMPSVFSRLETK